LAKLKEDFTVGNIRSALIRFCIPFLISNLLQALYGVADMWFVSRFNDAASMSGVNIGSQITHILTMAVSGLTVGGTILVAQFFGARKEKDVSETIGTMYTLLFGCAVVFSVLSIVFADTILGWLQTPAEAMDEARRYLQICMGGIIFVFGYNAVSAVQRGMGDSKRPLLFVAIACAINIFVDWLFVGTLDMGAAGAAWATVLSQGASFLFSAVYLSRSGSVFDFKPRSFAVKKDKVALLLKLGIPSSVQSIVVNLSFLLMTMLVNGFGVDASAAVGVAGKFNSFAILPAVAMSSSVSAIAAQNIVAGYHDRARKSMTDGIMIAMVFGILVFAVSQLFPAGILRLFTDEEAVIDYGVNYLRAFAFDYLLVPLQFCFTGLINAAGHTTYSFVVSLVSSVAVRIPLAWFLSRGALGLAGVGIAAPGATLCGIIIAFVFIAAGKWKVNKTGIKRES